MGAGCRTACRPSHPQPAAEKFLGNRDFIPTSFVTPRGEWQGDIAKQPGQSGAAQV